MVNFTLFYLSSFLMASEIPTRISGRRMFRRQSFSIGEGLPSNGSVCSILRRSSGNLELQACRRKSMPGPGLPSAGKVSR